MPWNTLATTDVTAEMLPDEVTMLNTIQGRAGNCRRCCRR